MANYHFEREARTPHSEAYSIESEEGEIGRVDVHFTGGTVHATLCVEEGLDEEALQELINLIDERIVMSADPLRDDFVVSVWTGRPGGVYSDFDEGEEEEEEMEAGEEPDHNGRHP